MIVVQRIVTTWTKQSRGGAAAARRNGVPEAFALPTAGRVGVVVHEVDAHERDDFASADTVRTLDRLPAVDSVRLAGAGWGAPRLAADQGTELQMAVAGVNHKTRDAMAVCDAVAPVASGVFLLEADDTLHVVISPPHARSPGYGPRQVFALQPGQWARWRFNGRFTPNGCGCHSHLWWYEKWVVNVGYHAVPSPDMFTSTAPERVVGNLVRLF